jgi:acyl dehydratase
VNTAELREHRFELAVVGEEFGPRRIVVDDARVKAFAFAQDDYGPWHFGPSPFGGPVAHPSLLANELMQIYFERFRIDVHEASEAGSEWLEEAHVEESLFCDAPLPVGETATLTGRFVAKYVVGGRGAVVLEGEARREDGTVVLRHRAIEYFRMDGPREDDGRREPRMRRVEVTEGGTAAERATRALAPGTPLPTLRKTVTFPQLLVYSTLEHAAARRSIHTDFEIAARAGLAAPLVQGQQLACHLAEALGGFFGEPWYRGGSLRTKFLGSVLAGDEVEVGGAVHGLVETGDAATLEVDLWVRRAGEIVAIATAVAAV